MNDLHGLTAENFLREFPLVLSEQRKIFALAQAIALGNQAEEMREAFKKGYEEAEKAWGGALPELSQKTYDATMKLFDDWANEADA